MALLFLEGFEEYGGPNNALTGSLAQGIGWNGFSNVGSGMGLSTTVARSIQPSGVTSKSLWGNNWASDTGASLKMPGGLRYYLGYGFRDDAATPTALRHVQIFTGAGRGVRFDRTTSRGFNAVAISGGATLATTSSNVYIQSIWHYFEIYIYAHASAGQLIMRVNGTEVMNQSSINTLNGGTGISSIYWTIGTTGPSANEMGYFDDLYVCDETGTKNNTFIGPLSVQTLIPNAAGDTTEFTPTSGNNFDRVATIPDSTSNYVTTSLGNQTDLYNISNLAGSGSTIPGVQVSSRTIKMDNLTRKQKALCKVGSTTAESAAWDTVMGTYTQDSRVFENQPSGSDWDVSAVNSLQIGVKS